MEPDLADPLAADIADAILAVDWSPQLPPGVHDLVGREVAAAMTQYKAIGIATNPPGGLTLRGAGREGQIVPGRLRFAAGFTGQHRRHFERSREFLLKHWGPVLSAVRRAGVEPTMVGVVLNLKASTRDTEADAHAFTKRLVVGYEDLDLAEAEVRFCYSKDKRYLTNITVGTYFDEVAVAPAGGGQELVTTTVDYGLVIKLDANTKYLRVFDPTANAPPVASSVLSELLGWIDDAYRRALPVILARGGNGD